MRFCTIRTIRTCAVAEFAAYFAGYGRNFKIYVQEIDENDEIDEPRTVSFCHIAPLLRQYTARLPYPSILMARLEHISASAEPTRGCFRAPPSQCSIHGAFSAPSIDGQTGKGHTMDTVILTPIATFPLKRVSQIGNLVSIRTQTSRNIQCKVYPMGCRGEK